jgi:hypothetical protein
MVGARLMAYVCAAASMVSGALAVWFFFRDDLQWVAVHLASWAVIIVLFLVTYVFIIHLLGRVSILAARVSALHRLSTMEQRSTTDTAGANSNGGPSFRGTSTGEESDVRFKRIEWVADADSDIC